MGNASQINRSRNSVRVERRSDLNESDLGEVYCMCRLGGSTYLRECASSASSSPSRPCMTLLVFIPRNTLAEADKAHTQRRGSAVVSTIACHAGGRGSLPGPGTLLG